MSQQRTLSAYASRSLQSAAGNQVARTFARMAFALANDFPRGESGLRDQLKRAALSIPLNIAEASGKLTEKDRKHAFDRTRIGDGVWGGAGYRSRPRLRGCKGGCRSPGIARPDRFDAHAVVALIRFHFSTHPRVACLVRVDVSVVGLSPWT